MQRNFCVSIVMTICLLLSLTGSLLTFRAEAADASSEMNTLIKNYGRTCSVLVYSIEDGLLFDYKKDTLITGASLIKLPYCVYVCRQITAGAHSLDETMTYTSSWYHGGSGIIRKNGYGKTYTVRQLLDYALRYSDNVAYDMLVYKFGVPGFNQMVTDWGYSIRIGQTSPRFPSVSADFMRYSMQEMAAHRSDGEPWRVGWTALCESTSTYVRGVLGTDNTPVAVKYGNVSAVWHEACYIDCETPYILIIMSSATNMSPNTTFLKNVAACARKIVNEHNEAKAATEPPTESPTEPPIQLPDELEDFDFIPVDESRISFGDLNGDGSTDATDAEWILNASAMLGARDASPLSPQQIEAADLNANGTPDASDAALVLAFIAYQGAGGTLELRDFVQDGSLEADVLVKMTKTDPVL